MSKRDLLLHTCCATCLCYVYELLKPDYNVIIYFHNPNIAPLTEYQKRIKDVIKFCKMKNIEFYSDEYYLQNLLKWNRYIWPERYNKKTIERCGKCYEFRLDRAFNFAKRKNIELVTTTLTISPYKNAEIINTIGKKLAPEYGIEFLEKDFKKNEGFKKTYALSKEYGFYRQNYCGCIFSKIERQVYRKGRRKKTRR